MSGKTQFEVSGGNVFYLLEKLKREGIFVYSARKTGKNTISFQVDSNKKQKVFAILRSSCYNVVDTTWKGVSALAEKLKRSVGLLVGSLLFCAVTVFAQSRVLKIEVVGSGAFYRAQAISILKERGVVFFSSAPTDTDGAQAELLSLPRVSFCSITHDGGILRVELQVSDEERVIQSEPLYSPATGVVKELTVLRGTACVNVGEEVSEGQIAVSNRVVYGEKESEVIVVAKLVVEIGVREEFLGEEQTARAEAFLKYGEITDYQIEKTQNGWLISGKATVGVSLNLE